MVSNGTPSGSLGSGPRAPARLLRAALAASALTLSPQLAAAQVQPARPQPQFQQQAVPPQQMAQQQRTAVNVPPPDQLTVLKLLWSTMLAVDEANRTGNYSVLRDLGSQGFQNNNNAASLANVFARLRQDRVDLSNTLLVAPTFAPAPTMVQPGVLRMRGGFNLRPVPILFDLIFQWSNGWRLEGVTIQAGLPARPAPAKPQAPPVRPQPVPARR
jgi:hypothetical protein